MTVTLGELGSVVVKDGFVHKMMLVLEVFAFNFQSNIISHFVFQATRDISISGYLPKGQPESITAVPLFHHLKTSVNK